MNWTSQIHRFSVGAFRRSYRLNTAACFVVNSTNDLKQGRTQTSGPDITVTTSIPHIQCVSHVICGTFMDPTSIDIVVVVVVVVDLVFQYCIFNVF